MDNTSGILLEGGAMRSVFSAGILDFFLEKEIHVPNVLAVSAGAYAGMNYVSGQQGRIVRANIEPLRNRKYMGFGTFLRTGNFFDMELLFDTIPKVQEPFDFDGFIQSGKRFIVNTINCETGEAVYHDTFFDKDSFLHICRAANSLPLIAKAVKVEGVPMLDGGMADAIPIRRALEEKWKKIIVIFTREASYRKSTREAYVRLLKKVYRKYPAFLKTIERRAARYNEAIDLVRKLEKEGRAFVYRPFNMTLQNQESNPDELLRYYRHGYEMAKEREKELKDFLRGE